jgi:putative alpha-1,2-mannosidase
MLFLFYRESSLNRLSEALVAVWRDSLSRIAIKRDGIQEQSRSQGRQFRELLHRSEREEASPAYR